MINFVKGRALISLLVIWSAILHTEVKTAPLDNHNDEINSFCRCGLDGSNYFEKEGRIHPMVIFQADVVVGCDSNGVTLCYYKCKNETSVLVDKLCEKVGHLTDQKAFLYYNFCDSSKWQNVGKVNEGSKICCHNHLRIDCSELKNLQKVYDVTPLVEIPYKNADIKDENQNFNANLESPVYNKQSDYRKKLPTDEIMEMSEMFESSVQNQYFTTKKPFTTNKLTMYSDRSVHNEELPAKQKSVTSNKPTLHNEKSVNDLIHEGKTKPILSILNSTITPENSTLDKDIIDGTIQKYDETLESATSSVKTNSFTTTEKNNLTKFTNLNNLLTVKETHNTAQNTPKIETFDSASPIASESKSVKMTIIVEDDNNETLSKSLVFGITENNPIEKTTSHVTAEFEFEAIPGEMAAKESTEKEANHAVPYAKIPVNKNKVETDKHSNSEKVSNESALPNKETISTFLPNSNPTINNISVKVSVLNRTENDNVLPLSVNYDPPKMYIASEKTESTAQINNEIKPKSLHEKYEGDFISKTEISSTPIVTAHTIAITTSADRKSENEVSLGTLHTFKQSNISINTESIKEAVSTTPISIVNKFVDNSSIGILNFFKKGNINSNESVQRTPNISKESNISTLTGSVKETASTNATSNVNKTDNTTDLKFKGDLARTAPATSEGLNISVTTESTKETAFTHIPASSAHKTDNHNSIYEKIKEEIAPKIQQTSGVSNISVTTVFQKETASTSPALSAHKINITDFTNEKFNNQIALTTLKTSEGFNISAITLSLKEKIAPTTSPSSAHEIYGTNSTIEKTEDEITLKTLQKSENLHISTPTILVKEKIASTNPTLSTHKINDTHFKDEKFNEILPITLQTSEESNISATPVSLKEKVVSTPPVSTVYKINNTNYTIEKNEDDITPRMNGTSEESNISTTTSSKEEIATVNLASTEHKINNPNSTVEKTEDKIASRTLLTSEESNISTPTSAKEIITVKLDSTEHKINIPSSTVEKIEDEIALRTLQISEESDISATTSAKEETALATPASSALEIDNPNFTIETTTENEIAPRTLQTSEEPNISVTATSLKEEIIPSTLASSEQEVDNSNSMVEKSENEIETTTPFAGEESRIVITELVKKEAVPSSSVSVYHKKDEKIKDDIASRTLHTTNEPKISITGSIKEEVAPISPFRKSHKIDNTSSTNVKIGDQIVSRTLQKSKISTSKESVKAEASPNNLLATKITTKMFSSSQDNIRNSTGAVDQVTDTIKQKYSPVKTSKPYAQLSPSRKQTVTVVQEKAIATKISTVSEEQKHIKEITKKPDQTHPNSSAKNYLN